MRWSNRVLVLVALPVLLAGCSVGEPGATPRTTTSAPASAAQPATAPVTSGWRPFWQGPATFAGGSGQPVASSVRLYPLQVVGTRLLLTVDLTVSSGAGTASLHPFCTGDSCWDLSGVSLIDTTGLARFGPLQAGMAGGLLMSSSTRGPAPRTGVTYRFGAFFADPGTDRVTVDLQQAGVVPGVPIETGRLPAPNLISTQAPSARWNPAPVTAGALVTAPVPALIGAFVDNRHGLVTSIGGAAVNATPGIVTLAADALFAPGSSAPSRRAPAPLARVAKALAGRVDPGRPVLVIGYTDANGDPVAGQILSQQRADAVAAALRSRLKKLQFVTAGRGQHDPVAANMTSTGKDSPSGRALNRRVVIAYAAKPPSAGATATPARPLPHPAVTQQDVLTALVRLGPSTVSSGGRSARLSAGISAVQVDGNLSLVTLDLRSDRRFTPAAAFSTVAPGSVAAAGQATSDPGTPDQATTTPAETAQAATAQAGVGAFHLIDRRTGQVFVPARDADDQTRVTGVFTHRMEARVSYTYSFLTAALPDDLITVDVALAGLGTARDVPVLR